PLAFFKTSKTRRCILLQRPEQNTWLAACYEDAKFSFYHVTFQANCMIRLSNVLFIFPRSVLFISRELGTEKLVLLKTLKASSRSSTPNRSLNLVLLISAVSTFQ